MEEIIQEVYLKHINSLTEHFEYLIKLQQEQNLEDLKKFVHQISNNIASRDQVQSTLGDWGYIQLLTAKIANLLDIVKPLDNIEEILLNQNAINMIEDIYRVTNSLVSYIEDEKSDPIKNLLQNLNYIAEELKVLHSESFTNKLKIFYDNLNHASEDVHIISIGYCGISEQRVYPWVFRTANEYPEIKFKIHLFDYPAIHDAYAITPISRDDFPDINQKYIYDVNNNWEWTLGEPFQFKHKQLNILVDIHNMHFPDSEYTPLLAEKLSNKLRDVIKQLLEKNKLVIIISQYFENNFIDPALMELFNKINQAKNLNYQNLFVVAHNLSYDLATERVDVYNQACIDYYVHNKFVENFKEYPNDFLKLLSRIVDKSINKESGRIVAPTMFELYDKYCTCLSEQQQSDLINAFLQNTSRGCIEFYSIAELDFDINNWLQARLDATSQSKLKLRI